MYEKVGNPDPVNNYPFSTCPSDNCGKIGSFTKAKVNRSSYKQVQVTANKVQVGRRYQEQEFSSKALAKQGIGHKQIQLYFSVMSQRIYRDYDRSYYDHSPSPQAQKPSKMAEIEAYVNILIQNNRVYADELNTLKRQNTDLRGQLEVLLGQLLREKEKHEQVLMERKAEYSREVGKLIDELKDILSKKQQMEGSYKSLLEELSYQSQHDKKARGVELQELERTFENKIKILNDRISEQNREIETNFYSHSEAKLRMVKEIDGLNYEVCELRKENNDLLQAHRFDQEEIARLSAAIKALNREKEDLGVNLLKVQQDKNHQIIELKQILGQLREQLNEQVDNVKKLEISILTKDKEMQVLIDKSELERRDKNQCEDYNLKLSTELTDKGKELATLKNEYNRLSEYSSKEIKRMSELLRTLEADAGKLNKTKQELEEQSRIKQEQIYTLLDRVQTLEAEDQQLRSQLLKERQLCAQYQQESAQLKQEIQSLLLDLRNQQEKSELQLKHIVTLEQVAERQRKKNLLVETQNRDSQLTGRKLSNELGQRYEADMEEMARRSEWEKQELREKFEGEKERLIRMYEKALRQKEITFKQKIVAMQNEIRQLSIC